MANKLSRITRNCIGLLTKQFEQAKGFSRTQFKQESNGRYSNYSKISSEGSFAQHVRQIKDVGEWLSEEKGVRKIGQIKKEYLVEYLNQCQAKGMAEKTLKSRVTAINHVMVGSGVWEAQQAISLKQLRSSGAISEQKGPRDVYKPLTASEWREREPRAYQKHKEVVDFARAFGLRRSEIEGKSKTGYNGVTFKNIGYLKDSKKLFVEVVGKGGKYRIATVREDMAKEMWDKYGKQAKEYSSDYFAKPLEERVAILRAETQKSSRVFSKIKKTLPLHINRNEYVQKRLEEKQDKYEKIRLQGGGGGGGGAVGYSRIQFKVDSSTGEISPYKVDYKNGERIVTQVDPFATVTIGTWRGYVIAACEVMQDVGHNRLDVINKYM